MSSLNVVASTPLLITSGAAILATSVALLPGHFARRHGPTLVSLAGIVAAIVMSVVLWGDRIVAFGGGFRADRFSLLFNILFLVLAAGTILLAWRDPASVDRRGEFAGLILIATAGMMLVVGAGDLISIFLGIEILSVAFYVLCAIEIWRERSLESGLKYLIAGAVGASVLLYGLTLLFGATGSTQLAEIGPALAGTGLTDEPLVLAAMVLIGAGLAFKASVAPFHMWAPDVYEGAPTTVTAFMSTATKAAAFAAFLRIFSGLFPDIQVDWGIALAVLAVASIAVGNIAALVQDNMKRLLAYSSIAQAGYPLIGVVLLTQEGINATMFYLVAYYLMNLGAFLVVIIVQELIGSERLQDYRGLGFRAPVVAACMTLFLFSLTGLPITIGFIGKFYLLAAVIQGDAQFYWLAVVAIINTVISLYYYARIIKAMYLEAPPEPATGRLTVAWPAIALLALLAVPTFVFGILFGPLYNLTKASVKFFAGI